MDNMTPQQLLQDYIEADKRRERTDGSWSSQWEIHNKLNDMGYYVERSKGILHLEKRQGYWGKINRAEGSQ